MFMGEDSAATKDQKLFCRERESSFKVTVVLLLNGGDAHHFLVMRLRWFVSDDPRLRNRVTKRVKITSCDFCEVLISDSTHGQDAFFLAYASLCVYCLSRLWYHRITQSGI